MSQSPLFLAPSYSLSSQWLHQTLTGEEESAPLCYLQTLKEQWTVEKVRLPESWMNPSNPLSRTNVFAHATTALCRIRDMITPLTLEEQQSRSIDVLSPQPDFLAARREDRDPELSIETACDTSNFPNFIRFAHIVFLRAKTRVTVPMNLHGSLDNMIDVLHKFFAQNPGFIVKRTICHGFSDTKDQLEQDGFALLVRQYGSKPEFDYDVCESIYIAQFHEQIRAVGLAMRISDTHPALILGTVYDPIPSDGPPLHRLAQLVQPSLDAVIKIWRLRQHQRGESLDPPPWLVLFSLAITTETVTIVAHYPIAEDASNVQPGWCVLDEIPYHRSICLQRSFGSSYNDPQRERWVGPADENDMWIRDRVRLSVALLTILTSVRRVAAIWDDIRWTAEAFALEDALEKRHAEWDVPTPSPSADEPDPDANPFHWSEVQRIYWEEKLDALVDEPIDPERERENELKNRQKVLAWRSKLQPSL